MKKFSDVQKGTGNFEGVKVKLDAILDKPLQLTGYQVTPSRFKDDCLTLQFNVEEEVPQPDGTKTCEWVQHICFTGSQKLVKQLDGISIDPADPILCKIIKQSLEGNRCFYKIVDAD